MLRCHDIAYQERLLIDALSFSKGEFWHVLGPNGAGKTTLFGLLSGITTPDTGKVTFLDKQLQSFSLSELAQCRTLLEQSYYCAFSIKVKELISFYCPDADKELQLSSNIPPLLEQAVEIAGLWDKSYDELSGGEKQRVQLARCLLQVWTRAQAGQALVILDEPLAGLDIPHQHKVMKLCRELSDLGNIVIASVHDINVCQQYATHACLMRKGKVVIAGQTNAVITLKNLEACYQHSFRCIRHPASKELIRNKNEAVQTVEDTHHTTASEHYFISQ